MYNSIKIAIADSHLAYCEALAAYLSGKTFTVLLYSDKPDAIAQLLDPANLPDIIIISCSTMHPESIATIKMLKNRFPGVKLLASVVFEHNLPIKILTDAGADGWIIKTLVDPWSVMLQVLLLCMPKIIRQGAIDRFEDPDPLS